MGVLECGCDLVNEAGGFFQRELLAFQQVVAQGAALDVGHDQVVPGALLAEIVERQDMVVGKRAYCQRFTLEASHERDIAAIQHLDGDLASDAAIICQVDFRHAALGDATPQFIASERKPFNPLHLSLTPLLLYPHSARFYI